MPGMTKAEKIETVVMCFLRNRDVASGECGSIMEAGHGSYRVTTEDGAFDVSSTRIGWTVTQPGRGVMAEDPDLLEAASMYFADR